MECESSLLTLDLEGAVLEILKTKWFGIASTQLSQTVPQLVKYQRFAKARILVIVESL